MLIPLGTERPLHRPTLITIVLIVVNVLIFLGTTIFEHFRPVEWNENILPNLWISGRDFHWWALFTSVFLHSGWMHLLGNMLILWVFGPNVEDRFGRGFFVLFYFIGGIAASGLHAAFDDQPAIGASGAIAAVSGAFLVLFPRTHVRCLVWFFLIGVFSIPSWWFIAFAIARDFIGFGPFSSGVAHLAHLGGYSFGILVSLFLLWRRILSREPFDLFTIGRQAYRRRQFKELTVQNDRSIARSHGTATNPSVQASDDVALARARIAEQLSRADWVAATNSYRQLVEQYGVSDTPRSPTILSRQHQMDIANQFFAQSDHQAAAYAYERFLDAYASDADAPRARLMLGLINARYLNDPIRAKAALAGLPERLTDASQRNLALKLIDELG